MQKSLTDALIRSVASPKMGRVELTDVRCPGLMLRITPAGVRSWSFRFRDPCSSAVQRATIGTYPAISLLEARERAGELRRRVAGGENPIHTKRRERDEASTKTVEFLAECYLREHAYRKKRSAPADDRNLRLHVLPHWGKRRFDEIRRRDVVELCEAMVTAGKPIQANRVQALISKMFSFAIDRGLVTAHPCYRLEKCGRENVGRRVLTDAELRLSWDRVVLPPVSRAVGLALQLALLTGGRAGEVAGLGRRELEHLHDATRATWTVPAERCKSRRPHIVPLSGMAQAIVIEALRLAPAECEYLFPSPAVRGRPITGHALAVAMSRLSDSLDGRSQVEAAWKANPPTPHDLRRTFATRLAALGTSRDLISTLLNHAPRGVTATHYDLYERIPEKRRALEAWASSLQHIIMVEDGQTV